MLKYIKILDIVLQEGLLVLLELIGATRILFLELILVTLGVMVGFLVAVLPLTWVMEQVTPTADPTQITFLLAPTGVWLNPLHLALEIQRHIRTAPTVDILLTLEVIEPICRHQEPLHVSPDLPQLTMVGTLIIFVIRVSDCWEERTERDRF